LKTPPRAIPLSTLQLTILFLLTLVQFIPTISASDSASPFRVVGFDISSKVYQPWYMAMYGGSLYIVDTEGKLAKVNTTALEMGGADAITTAEVFPFESGGCCGNFAGAYGLAIRNGFAWVGGTYNVGRAIVRVSLVDQSAQTFFQSDYTYPGIGGLAADDDYVYAPVCGRGIVRFHQTEHAWSMLPTDLCPGNLLLDGNTLWYSRNPGIGKVNTDGTGLTSYTNGFSSNTAFLSKAPDGRIWFTENRVHKIGVFDPVDASVTEYDFSGGSSGEFDDGPYGLTFDADGRLWVAGGSFRNVRQFDPVSESWGHQPDVTFPGRPFYLLGGGDEIWGDGQGLPPSLFEISKETAPIPAADFTITAETPSLELVQGGSATVTITARSGVNFSGTISLSSFTLNDGYRPVGLFATIDPPILSLQANQTMTAILTIFSPFYPGSAGNSTVTVAGSYGTISYYIVVTVRVLPNMFPVADFTFNPSAPEVGEPIIFDASASYDPDGGTIASYLWFFGDGYFSTTGPVVSHTYATAGAYLVMLTVRDDEYVSTSTAGTVNVGPTDIVRNAGVQVGDWARYSFEATHPDVDDITGFLFNVQDVTGSNVTLMVTLTFRNGTVTTMESELDVTKLSSAGFALIGSGLNAGDQIYADAAFKVNATVSEPVLGANREINILNLTQTIPDTVSTYTEVKWDRTSGVLIYQNITATAGSTESTAIAIVGTNIWANEPPVASFSSSPSNPLPGQTVTFDAGESSDPYGEITDYSWDFGDGGTATGVTVSHSYSSPGTFTVSLTVTDDQGATHAVSRTITILAQTGILRIIVRDQAGNLISGIVVRITSGPAQPGELRTGSDGSVTFENLPVGQYGFEVAGAGFLTAIDSVTVQAGQQPVERTVNLSPAQQAPSIPSSDGVYIGVAAAVVVILGGVLVYVWRTRAKKARIIKAA